MKNNSIKARVFLVGCPRSGTTLLQSMLAAHPKIISFPESKFFQRAINPDSFRSKFGLVSTRARANFNQFFADINRKEMQQLLPNKSPLIHQHSQAFIKALDLIAIQQNKSCWLEKTPAHLHRINYIEKLVNNAKFIHIIRNGIDVVSSLYSVSSQYPEIWNGAWNIDKCIQRWLNDIHISNLYSEQYNHSIVKYEALIENPQLELEKLCKFIEIYFDKQMICDRHTVTKDIIRKNEEWKSSVSKEIQNSKQKKFYNLFDANQRKYILNKISVTPNKYRIIL
ncbi:conserved hypothetical protein [Hyella patelloides LEGE 07179]|uniref:Sulfotransferase n=1 Tax=Hyella patelloides LEGE 07179 TaxID=945734 RepID=A0A563W5I6_9CYAN|nr:sulfotransferase [Hyella patelloides]VEP18900.1 conserved hypothetical protein [Hyella patelloides LEGE 07179]